MTSYIYKALHQDGTISKGDLHASNPLDLEARLTHMGLELISYRRKSSLFAKAQRSISQQDLAMLCYQLEQLHNAGVPLLEALHDLRDSCQHSQLKNVLRSICTEVEGGKTLSEALAFHGNAFNVVFVNLIAAGEHAGKLSHVLHHLYQTLSWQKELLAQSKRLLAYPIFLALVMLLTIIFLMSYLVPQMVAFLNASGHALPMNTRILITISHFCANYWWGILLLPISFSIFVIYLLHKSKHFRQRFDAFKLKLPILGGILKKIILARYTRYFALMYEAGIPMLQALKISESITGNLAVTASLQSVQLQMNAGNSVYKSFSSVGFFPQPLLHMIRVGENAGKLDKTLLNISQFYENEVRTEVAQLLSMLEPMLTVVLGSVLAFIMLSVLGPIYASFGDFGS